MPNKPDITKSSEPVKKVILPPIPGYAELRIRRILAEGYVLTSAKFMKPRSEPSKWMDAKEIFGLEDPNTK